MTNSERASYIRGLMDGLELDPAAKETKVFNAMVELLDDLCLSMEAVSYTHLPGWCPEKGRSSFSLSR